MSISILIKFIVKTIIRVLKSREKRTMLRRNIVPLSLVVGLGIVNGALCSE